jgi:hypothetical protein
MISTSRLRTICIALTFAIGAGTAVLTQGVTVPMAAGTS